MIPYPIRIGDGVDGLSSILTYFSRISFGRRITRVVSAGATVKKGMGNRVRKSSMKLSEIAARLGCDLEGAGDVDIIGIAGIESAREGELSFFVDRKYASELKSTKASGLIVARDFSGARLPLLRHQNPKLAFAKAVELFHPPIERLPGIDPTALIDDSALIGEEVSIGAFTRVEGNTVIGNRVRIGSHCLIAKMAIIGDESRIESGCVVREGVAIGKRCTIQDRAVIGSEGFGYAKQDDGSWYRIHQAGTVILEDDVDIGAGTTIDRPAFGATFIGRGTKIDNLVQIGHGCRIGRNSMICAQVGLAGSTKIGDNVVLAGQVGAAGHLTIGDGVVATAQTGIPNSVDSGRVVSGYPAIDNRLWLKSSAVFNKLPELSRTLRSVLRRVEALENTFNK
jgi:UDP-3-O-[3-hydroxymyristoyl] glucosamine N-acyltransferase